MGDNGWFTSPSNISSLLPHSGNIPHHLRRIKNPTIRLLPHKLRRRPRFVVNLRQQNIIREIDAVVQTSVLREIVQFAEESDLFVRKNGGDGLSVERLVLTVCFEVELAESEVFWLC